MAHRCHATACMVAVPPEMFTCRRHWFMLPKALRDAIWKAYRRGQCDDMSPSREYCLAAKAAVTWLAEREGFNPETRLYDLFLARREREHPVRTPIPREDV